MADRGALARWFAARRDSDQPNEFDFADADALLASGGVPSASGVLGHVAEAVRILGDLVAADQPIRPDAIIASAAVAQVHATLALEARQRQANILRVALLDQAEELERHSSIRIRDYLGDEAMRELGL